MFFSNCSVKIKCCKGERGWKGCKELNVRPKIDETDITILKTLLNDPRTSFADIAKDCGMSTSTIRMRFKRLKKDGIITGAITQVNPKNLGYNCIALLSIQAAANEEKSVYNFVEKIPEVIKSFQPIGRYNILTFAALKSTDELAHTVEQINSHPHVRNVQECILVDIVLMDHPKNLVIEPFNGLTHTAELMPKDENPQPVVMPSHVAEAAEESHSKGSYNLDKLDKAIMAILSRNADMPFRKVAKKVDVSTQSVIRRYNRLRKTVLPYSSITLDLRKLGYIGTAIFYIKTSHQHTTSNVFNKLLRVPNIIVAFKCLGTIDIAVTAPFSNFNQLLKLKEEISKTPGVNQIELLVNKPFPTWPLNLSAQLLPEQK
jgi:Lrp/AsnC family transcriptional regulator for asnA, asnC and gidA